MKKHNGIALTLTLLILVVLLTLMGAFIHVYQAHYAVARRSVSGRQAQLGCESVHDYIAYRLEHDRGWAGQPFEKVTPIGAFGGTVEATEVIGTHRVEGAIPSLDLTFEAEIYSNLTDDVDEEVSRRVDRGHALCKVRATRGSATKQTEAILTVVPPFDSSVLTRADLYVDSYSLLIEKQR